LCSLLGGQTAWAADRKIDRTIKREPKYATSPTYGLLLLGSEGETRIWIVRDNDRLYVDRNANGDLTDDEPVKAPKKGYGTVTFQLGELLDRHSQRRHTSVELAINLGSAKLPVADTMTINLDIDGRYQVTSSAEVSHKPETAPVFHLGQPLYATASSDLTFTPGVRTVVTAAITSWSPGVAACAVNHSKAVPDDVHPIAEITFPGQTDDSEPIELKVPLTHRCCGNTFYEAVRVPADVGEGKARIKVSFDDWKAAKVEPTTVDVVVTRQSKRGPPPATQQ
jgi:hypothetical protein